MAKAERMGSGIKPGLAGSNIRQAKESLSRTTESGSSTTSLFGGDLYCMKDPFGADLYTRRPPFGGSYYCEIYGSMLYG